MDTVDTDVLVVGAGPTGLVASAFLARLGVRAVTIARHPGTAPQPRATITNQRSVEVYRDLGIEDRVRAVGVPLAALGNNVFATSLTGQEIFRYASYGTGERMADYAAASPCPNYNAPQHVLEPELLAAARGYGSDIRFGHELIKIEQTDDAVLARVRALDSGEEYRVRARYAIGADGSRSRVAEQLGFSFTGQTSLTAHMFNMWIEADLREYTAYRPSVIYMILQPGADQFIGSGSFMCMRPWDEWVLVRQYDPADGGPDRSDAAVIEYARSIIGDADTQIRVKGTSKWQVNNAVATEYRRGRVLLAGDAAHRHPPSGGLGCNTSVQDAFNLAWKLAFVISGRAGDDLLTGYHEERQPVGQQVVDRTLQNLLNQGAPVQALGLGRGQSAEQGWESLRHVTTDDPGAAERREELARAVALQHYRSNAQGVDLGQRYTSRVIVDDGTPFPAPTRDPDLYYHPTTHPGGYLPHAWVEHHHKRVSTLDLAGHDRFCLIVGIGGARWAEAAKQVSEEFGLDLAVFAVGYRCEYDDVLGDWASLREISDRGALLVRPDRVIAWRSASLPDHLEELLRSAVRQALGLHDEPADAELTPQNARNTATALAAL